MALCYRCGAPASEPAEFCPQCGTRLASRNQGLDLFKIFGAISLMLSTLVVGAAGACFIVISDEYLGPDSDSPPIPIAIGITLIAIATLFFFGFCKLYLSARPHPVWLIVLTLFGMVIPALGAYPVFGNIFMFRPMSGLSTVGRGPGVSTIMILAAVVGASALLIFAANKFFKRK